MAVVAVVLFHAGVARAQGGFLGVSLFFTLSGFLITRLLLAELARDGRVALRAFWGRRVRRLAPAALLCLVLVLATSPWLVTPVEMQSLRGDIVAGAANIANWRFLTAGQSYAELFAGRPSPVLHFWSLAIEEQFYFVFPCIVAFLSALRRRWALPVGLLALALGAFGATLATHDHDLVYYGTHTRAGELLIGALMAWVMSRLPTGLDGPRRVRMLSIAASLGLIGFVVLVMTTEQSAGWLYRGGFIAAAVLWCPMIAASTTSGSWSRILGWAPLSAVGRRSYGIYLFHWPVFTLVRPSVLHLDGWAARVVQLALIALLTEGSYRLVEGPIREHRVLVRPVTMRVASLATIAAVIAVALVVPAGAAPSGPRISMLDAPDEPVLLTPSTIRPASGSAEHVAVASSSTPITTASTPPVRITIIGSELSVVRSLHAAADGIAGVRIVNDVVPHCTPIAFDDPWPLAPSCPNPPAPPSAGDVLIIAFGEADHLAFTDRLAAGEALAPAQRYAIAQHLGRLGVDAIEAFAATAARVVVIDTAPAAGDPLDAILDEASLSTTNLSRDGVDAIDPAAVRAWVAPTPPPSPSSSAALRVLVIGDSTSYGVATGLAASAEHLVVLWAGKRNCALIPLDASTLVDQQTSAAGCPTVHDGWPAVVASFRPDVIVAVTSLPEEAEQRYVGDPQWYAPGSDRYVAEHDAGMRDLVALAASTGAVIEVATAPANPSTGPGGWTAAAGIDAWNAQIQSWDVQSPVVETIGYGALIEAAEAAAGHSLRPDGVHLDDASVTAIVGGWFAPLLVQQATAARARLAATGCLVLDQSGNHLDPPACS